MEQSRCPSTVPNAPINDSDTTAANQPHTKLSKRKHTRSTNQRFERKQQKSRNETIQKQIETENTTFLNTLTNISTKITKNTITSYGFAPDASRSIHLNARKILGNTPIDEYFPTVTNLAFHDLTSQGTLPPSANSLLGLGLKYIPTPKITITQDDMDKTLSRFERDIGLTTFFAGSEDDTSSNTSPEDYKLRVKSIWRAPLPPQDIDTRIERFSQAIRASFVTKHKVPTNLERIQNKLLKEIKQNPNVMIAPADKGLGPVGVDTEQYIAWGMKHLTDASTYTIISNEKAHEDTRTLRREIFNWTTRHRQALTDNTINYIRHHLDVTKKDPFGYFYLLVKLHKTPVSTRPVCSDCASLPHALGKWVDLQLQPLVQQQTTYFKNSLALKNELDMLHLPPNACIFTYDAISMYTNINTEDCISRLSTFLLDPNTSKEHPHLRPHALVEALSLVMHNNRMKFGDLIVQQHKGIAMGMSPAPTIANLYVAIFEAMHIVAHPPRQLHYLRRFIDDGFGIWLMDENESTNERNWNSFQAIINSMGLTWEFSDLSYTVTFMDLTITLDDGKFTTKLYAKPMALHLYIPPSSCHAPGIINGLIHGHFLRVYQLCSHQHDIDREIDLFYQRLLDRGHSPNTILPLFAKAEERARQISEGNQADNKDKLELNSQLFFHLPFHPSNPSSKHIQTLWHDIVAAPPNEEPLSSLKNKSGFSIPIEKLTIAYSRAPNIGNLLSCRKLKKTESKDRDGKVLT